MVLVDTKTEHGVNSAGQIVVADEVYTMDSSRFWRLDENNTLMTRDGKPVSFSKEFARGMVTEKNSSFPPNRPVPLQRAIFSDCSICLAVNLRLICVRGMSGSWILPI